VPRWARYLLIVFALAFAALPASFIVTFLLYPFWSWIEVTYGIESVGHSGPADWCFEVIYAILLALSLAVLWRNKGRKPE